MDGAQAYDLLNFFIVQKSTEKMNPAYEKRF